MALMRLFLLVCSILLAGCGAMADDDDDADMALADAAGTPEGADSGSSMAGMGGAAPAGTGGVGGGAGGMGGAGGDTTMDGGLGGAGGEEKDAPSFWNVPPEMMAPASCLPDPSDESDTCVKPECADLRSCCVGDGACCSPVTVAGVPQQLDFSVCDGSDLPVCLTGEGWPAKAFGPRASLVRGNTFRPGGDDSGDGGLRFESEFDLSSRRVTVSAVFHAASRCGADCLEGVGFGFLDGDGIPSHITGEVALIYSGSLGQVRLVINGEVAGQTPLDGENQKWTLEIRPSGQVLAFAGQETRAAFDVSHAPSFLSRLLVFGQSRDPARNDGARLSELAVNVEQCDIPGVWRERAPLTLREPDGKSWAPDTPASPRAAYDGDGRAALVFEVDGAIHFARRDGKDPLVFDLATESSAPALSKALLEGATGLRDPWLIWRDGRWIVFFAVDERASGSYLARAEAGPEGSFDQAIRLDIPWDAGALDAPTVAVDLAGQFYLIAREDERTFGVFWLREGDRWERAAWSLLDDFLSGSSQRLAESFRRDAIDAPALTVNNGAAQLYYAGRRGTRWAIGLLVSDDLVGWRPVPWEGPVVQAQGSDFERHSVYDPQAVARKGVVELFYVGSDGYRSRLGRAWRYATDQGTPD